METPSSHDLQGGYLLNCLTLWEVADSFKDDSTLCPGSFTSGTQLTVADTVDDTLVYRPSHTFDRPGANFAGV